MKMNDMTRKEREEYIESKRTPKGGFTKATLAEWGVPWQPPKGWKKWLVDNGSPYTV